MRLTTFSDYSLRVLMYMGLRQHDLATIADIAEAYGISRNHLMKVVQHLASAGYVETVRGKGGGLRLSRSPESICIGEVLRATEDDALLQCLSPSSDSCHVLSACVLPHMFREATEAFFASLDRHTLADLLVTGPRLASMLGIPVVSAK